MTSKSCKFENPTLDQIITRDESGRLPRHVDQYPHVTQEWMHTRPVIQQSGLPVSGNSHLTPTQNSPYQKDCLICPFWRGGNSVLRLRTTAFILLSQSRQISLPLTEKGLSPVLPVFWSLVQACKYISAPASGVSCKSKSVCSSVTVFWVWSAGTVPLTSLADLKLHGLLIP